MVNKKFSQLKFEKNFLEKLLSKLTVGNGRSIHLNAVPGRAKNRLDISDLDIASVKPISTDFLDKLTSKEKFEYKISFDSSILTKADDDLKNKLSTISKKLDAIVSDNEDMYLETGIKNFGFGYPLIIKADTKAQRVIVSPVFIWMLDIKKSNKKNEWIISKTEDSPIKVNELLISHIKNDEQIELDKLTSEELDDNILSKEEIIAYLNNLLKKLNCHCSIDNVSLTKSLLTKKEYEKLANNEAWIQWSGILGLYKSPKETIIDSVSELIKKLEKFNSESLEISPFQKLTTTSFDIDSSKREIIDTLDHDEFKIIQGPPGTGKSQAISAIISNVLANKAKVLVVCEKKTALDVLKSNLQKEKLDEFSILIDDVIKDRKSVVDKARKIFDEIKFNYSHSYFDDDIFSSTYSCFLDLKDKVNAAYEETSKNIFLGKNWKDIIGEYLKVSKEHNIKEVIDNFKKFAFSFTEEEFNTYIDNIKRGIFLQNSIKSIDKNTFCYIDFNAFDDKISLKQKNDIERQIDEVEHIVNKAKQYLNSNDFSCLNLNILSPEGVINKKIELIDNCMQFITSINEFCNSNQDLTVDDYKKIKLLFENYNKVIKSIDSNLNILVDNTVFDKLSNIVIIQSIIKNMLDICDKFSIQNLNHSLKNLVLGWFNTKYKEYFKNFKKFKSLFSELYSKSNKYSKYNENVSFIKKYKEYKQSELLVDDLKNLNLILDNDKLLFSNSLSEYYNSIIEAKKTLNEYNINCKSIIDCKVFIEKTNKSITDIFKLITNDIKSSLISIKDYLSQLDTILNKVSLLKDNLSQLDDYNSWIKFYKQNKKLINALEEYDNNSWENIFKTVYFCSFLYAFENNSKISFNKNDGKLKRLDEYCNKLQSDSIGRIYDVWNERRIDAADYLDCKYGFKALFALKKNQKFGKRLSLKQIINKDFNSFTDLFPVILVNPIVANTLFPLKQGLFDIVIFDESSQLRVEDVYTAMLRGKYKIIAGDQHQMPPSNYFGAKIEDEDMDSDSDDEIRDQAQLNAESLLVFSESLKYKNISYLDFHYRSQHPLLIQFSNAAFYGENLCPLPVKGKDYTPIIMKEVNGTYYGTPKNINSKEADEVIKILESINEDENGNMPSVGIATFNVHQRELIKEKLYDKAYSDPKNFGVKFEKLQSSGLFVKNLENIQGDERDIIIISTTFGKDETGKLSERFGVITQENAYKLLNVLITRAKDKLFVVTSIPETKYSQYKELLDKNHQNNRTAIFYAYLSYAKAVSENNMELVNSILSDVSQFSYDRSRNMQGILGTSLVDSPFEEELYNQLSEVVGKNNIHYKYKVGGYTLDFMIEYNGKKFALECDGKQYPCFNQAYAENIQREKQIEKFGYKFYRIWSINWFENEKQELQKLKDFLSKS